jgi:hypothetical protein
MSKSDAAELKKIDAELAKNQQEINKQYKEIVESNSFEKIEQAKKTTTNVLSNTKKEIPINTFVEVVSIDNTDKNYNSLKEYINKKGTTKTALKQNSDGTYSGMIEFTFDFNVIRFEKVNVKIIP